MPSILNATTTSGLVTSADNSGSLQLQTNNGTTAVTIDTSQNVGIGTSSPTSKLHVKDGAVNIENTSGYGVIEMGGSSGAFLDMKNPFSDDYDLRLQTDGSTAFVITAGSIPMTFQTNNTERMRIDSSGNVGIGTTATDGVLTVNKANAGHKIVATNGTNAAWSEIGSYAGATNQVKAQLFAEENGASSYVKIGARSNHYCAFTTNDTERMRITSGGSLLVNATTGTDFRMRVSGSNAATFGDDYDSTVYGAVQIIRPANQGTAFHLSFVRGGQKVAGMGFLNNSNTFAIQNQGNNGGSGVTLTDGATSWGTTSDERKKDIIAPIENALTKLANWRSVYYKYKIDDADAPQRVGLIAQDVHATLPEAISVEEDEIKTLQLRYTETIPLLVKAIQEQQAMIETLKTELDTVKSELNTLKNPPVEGTE